MFITNTAFKSTLSGLLSGPGEAHWRAVELALNKPWYLVTMREIDAMHEDEEFVILRTVLASNVADVEHLAQKKSDGLPRFDSVQIITPDRINGTGTWKMEPLSAVWVAEEPAAPGSVVEICETQTGLKYVTSFCAASLNELENHTLRYRFSS